MRAAWQHVVVVEVAEVHAASEADKLKVVQSRRRRDGTRTIVCGAPQRRRGHARARWPRPGAIIGGKTIEKAKLRGVRLRRHAVLRARARHLIEEHAGWSSCRADWPLGTKLGRGAARATRLLEIGITPQPPRRACATSAWRASLAAAFSFARQEARACLLREDGGDVGERVGVEIQEQNGCKRYRRRARRRRQVGPSPALVRARLEHRSGMRPINNVVDATNWVMLELGHPLHAFDLERLVSQGKQKRVIVRRATADEAMTTLDGQQTKAQATTISSSPTRSAPSRWPVSWAAENSEITDGTTEDVLIESGLVRAGGRLQHRQAPRPHDRGSAPLLARHRHRRACRPPTIVSVSCSASGAAAKCAAARSTSTRAAARQWRSQLRPKRLARLPRRQHLPVKRRGRSFSRHSS